MNIEKLFSTKERIKILERTIYSKGILSVNRTAKESGLSKGLVSKYFDILAKEGIIKKIGLRFAVKDCLKTRAVRILLNLLIFEPSFFRKYGFVKSAGIYGSMAKGANNEDSDIDMWVLVDKTREENLAKLTSELKKSFGNVKPIYLTREKVKMMREKDEVFYHSLIFGSVIIYGDGIEAV